MFLDSIRNWLAEIKQNYGVNPVIFAIIYFGCTVPFWFSIYKIIAGLKKKDHRQVRAFGIMLALAIIAPFVYVAMFGHSIPVWFWMIAAALILYSAFTVLRRFGLGSGTGRSKNLR
jgi:hypothetical protein